MRRTGTRAGSLAITAALATAAAAAGQAARPGTPPPLPDEPLLAGPQVREAAVEAVAAPREGRARIPQRQWVRAVRSLDLAAGQERDLGGLLRAFRRERTAFDDLHGEEIRGLRATLTEARRNGTPPPDGIVARLRERQALGPSFEACQRKIWDLLDDEQRQALRQAIREAEQARRRRQRERAEAAPEAMSTEAPAESTGEGPTSRPAADDPDRRERRRRRFRRADPAPDGVGAGPTEAERRFEFEEGTGD